MKIVSQLSVSTFILIFMLLTDTAAQTIKENLDVKKFQRQLSETKEAVLLDVRTPGEIKQGYISGAVFIDYNNPEFEKKISSLDKSKTYFVYCAVGGRSSKTLDLMEKQGFKKIYNLTGGFDAWKKADLPVKR